MKDLLVLKVLSSLLKAPVACVHTQFRAIWVAGFTFLADDLTDAWRQTFNVHVRIHEYGHRYGYGYEMFKILRPAAAPEALMRQLPKKRNWFRHAVKTYLRDTRQAKSPLGLR